MAVYERGWRPWVGQTTAPGRRWVVITRYGLETAFSSRVFTAYYVVCMLPTVAALLWVYAAHNAALLGELGAAAGAFIAPTAAFFRRLFLWQAVPAFFLAVVVAPHLVAPDLSNNALPLYLARAIRRREYVLGKLAILAALLSPPTWIGGLLVTAVDGGLDGASAVRHGRIAVGFLVGHLAWVAVISLLTLAVSAWVRHKSAARAALVGVFFILGAAGDLLAAATRSGLAYVIDPMTAIATVVQHLFDRYAVTELSPLTAWLTLLVTALISLWILYRKLRAHEVIR